MSAEDFLDERGDSLMDTGKLVKLVRIQDDILDFDADLARSLFECPEVKSNPVAIITVLGKGKSANSMLLSKMIHHAQNLQIGGEKIPEEDIIANFKTILLESNQEEMNIVTWSKPIFVPLGACGQVAVFFLNIVSGTSDENMLSIPEDRIKKYYELAGLCLYLSSNAVYIEMGSLENVDWSHIARISAEGLRCAEIKQHQKITFLIRDWDQPSTFSHGEKGGDKALKYFKENSSSEQVSQVAIAFSGLNCFLLPPFKDKNERQTRIIFENQYGKFQDTVLHRCYIDPKKIAGSPIKGFEIVELVQDYIASIERNDPPMDLADLQTENNSSSTPDPHECLNADEMITEIRKLTFTETPILTINGDQERNAGEPIFSPRIAASVEARPSPNKYESVGIPSAKISLEEYLKKQGDSSENREIPTNGVVQTAPPQPKPRPRPRPSLENEQFLSTHEPEEILRKYKREPLESFIKGKITHIQYHSSSVPEDFDKSNVISDSTEEIQTHNKDPEDNSIHPIHCISDSMAAAEFAIDVAAKYYNYEITKAKDAAQSREEFKNSNKLITEKIGHALKYACDLSSTDLPKEYKEKLQEQFDQTFQDLVPNVVNPSLGIHLTLTEIFACTFVGSNCVNVSAKEDFSGGFWVASNEITFEKPRNTKSKPFSLSVLFSASISDRFEVDRARFLSAEELIVMLFRKIKQTAEQQLNSSIPLCALAMATSFKGIQRDLIRKSVQLAGFKRVELINESCAAAISYTMEPDSPTPEKLLVVMFSDENWTVGCYKHNRGQLTLTSIREHFLDRKTRKGSIDTFRRITTEVKNLANFGDDTLTLLVGGSSISLSIKEQTQQPFKIRRSDIVTRGAAIYAGLLGGNIKLHENWSRATSSEFTLHENVLLSSEVSNSGGMTH